MGFLSLTPYPIRIAKPIPHLMLLKGHPCKVMTQS